MGGYQQQRNFAEEHSLRACELIGRSNIVPTGVIADTQLGSDLIIMNTGAGSVAMRTRSSDALQYSEWDFTSRAAVRGGGPTEFDKIMAGMCNWMFYGVLNEQHTDYQRWMLFHLGVLRDAVTKWRAEKAAGIPVFALYRFFWNRDDGTGFNQFNACHRRLRHPLFMIDCHDPHRYPGEVGILKTHGHMFRRPANNNAPPVAQQRVAA